LPLFEILPLALVLLMSAAAFDLDGSFGTTALRGKWRDDGSPNGLEKTALPSRYQERDVDRILV
jgi:hypothetical protein